MDWRGRMTCLLRSCLSILHGVLQFFYSTVDCFQVIIHYGLKVGFAIMDLCELGYSHIHVYLMIFGLFLFR